MKLVQAREWADIYLSSPHLSQEAYSLEAMLIEKKDEGAKHVAVSQVITEVREKEIA